MFAFSGAGNCPAVRRFFCCKVCPFRRVSIPLYTREPGFLLLSNLCFGRHTFCFLIKQLSSPFLFPIETQPAQQIAAPAVFYRFYARLNLFDEAEHRTDDRQRLLLPLRRVDNAKDRQDKADNPQNAADDGKQKTDKRNDRQRRENTRYHFNRKRIKPWLVWNFTSRSSFSMKSPKIQRIPM